MANPIKRWLSIPLGWVAGRAEARLLQAQRPVKYPPIFLIGPSRSGSTLLSQVMVYAMDVGYLSNAMMQGIRFRLVRCRRALKRYGRPRPEDFQSKFGITEGPTGVSTASAMWLAAFRDGQGELHAHLPDEEAGRTITGVFAMVTTHYDAPVVNKWTGNAARIEAIAKLFPSAVFIRVRRDAMDVVQSMLNARIAEHDDPYRPLISWPSAFDQPTGGHYTDQICEHLFRIERAIDEGVAKLDKKRVIESQYKDLCAAPNEEIKRIAAAYEQATDHAIRIIRDLPATFPYSHSKKVSEEDYELFTQGLQARGLTFNPIET